MSLYKDIQDLVNEEVISNEVADKIRDYYSKKGKLSNNRLFVVFGILGAILIGLGIILIIAHNWDELSRLTKSVLAFVPLLIGQVLCGYALIKKRDNVAWTESSSAFLFFSVGASISLISQIYNIPGNLSSFLLTWMLLCLPLVYLMRSSITSLFYIIGITFYAAETSYWSYPSSESYLYWLLLLFILPHYYLLFKNKLESNFMIFHNWFIPLSVTIILGTLVDANEEFILIAYFSFFAFLFLIGNFDFFSQQKAKNNSYKILGSLGTIVLLLMLSFDAFWVELHDKSFQFNEILLSPEFLAATVISLLATGLLYLQFKNKSLLQIKPIALVFILFIIIFLIGLFSTISVLLINIVVLAIGILTIRDGAKQDHLGILNFGLLIITALVICRFFDESLSFVIRGILFVIVGIGFFATNYWILKKRKTNE